MKLNKRRGAVLKLLGTTLVLAAFAVQHFWHDQWKETAEFGTKLLLHVDSAKQRLERSRGAQLSVSPGAPAFTPALNESFLLYLLSMAELCRYRDCRGWEESGFPLVLNIVSN